MFLIRWLKIVIIYACIDLMLTLALPGQGIRDSWAFTGFPLCPDSDGDAITDPISPLALCVHNGQDNCPTIFNPDQNNIDHDSLGDICDPDDDNDGIEDSVDNCPVDSNPGQNNIDHDSLGDICDPDDDNDGIEDSVDNCPVDSNPGQNNTDGDSQGNRCDSDDDNDGVSDTEDAFPLDSSESVDTDGDGIGDNADPDDDGDGVPDDSDAFPLDAAESVDTDSDGTGDNGDNCPDVANVNQLDTDGDGFGNVCDADDDNDGVLDGVDTFPLNPAESVDTDGDGMGDNYEARFGLDVNDPADAALDNDSDGASNLEEFERHRNPLVNEHAVLRGVHPMLF